MGKLTFEPDVIFDTVHKWLNGEVARMGDQFRTFEITWHRDDMEIWLEIQSKPKPGVHRLDDRMAGRTMRIVTLRSNEEGVALPIIQGVGCALYYSLRGKYPTVHDWGGQA